MQVYFLHLHLTLEHKIKGVDRCSSWHSVPWSHLGTEDPDNHLPQGRGIGSWLDLKQQVLLLPGSEFGSTDKRKGRSNSMSTKHMNACTNTQSNAD